MDLAKGFSHFGFKQQMGLQKAVALLFGQYLAKSKKSELQTGHESHLHLSKYAPADAYAALLVFEELRNQNYYLLTFHKLFKPHFKRKV